MNYVWYLTGGVCRELRIVYFVNGKNYKNFFELLVFKVLNKDFLYYF